jgi:hypothetical protein
MGRGGNTPLSNILKEMTVNNIETRLIELNQALLKLTTGIEKTADPKLLEQAVQVLSGASMINTGPGNDTVIMNKTINGGNGNGCECPPGPPGEKGDKGDKGDTGNSDCIVDTLLIDSTYYATEDDCYIGVNSEGPTTVYLPKEPPDGKIIIVKAEMKPPLGNRKITITTQDGTLIDSYTEITIQVSHESVTLIYRGESWHVIT